MPPDDSTGRPGRDLPGLVLWLGLSLLTGAIGSVASTPAPEFYAQLDRPSWSPPSWLFGPVWTTLYVLMGIAAWLVWRERHRMDVRPALLTFVVQLVLNALWSWIFFAWRMGGLALAEILVLAAAIVATIVLFRRVRPLAGALLLPYLAWVLFATALTLSLWRANPGLL